MAGSSSAARELEASPGATPTQLTGTELHNLNFYSAKFKIAGPLLSRFLLALEAEEDVESGGLTGYP